MAREKTIGTVIARDPNQGRARIRLDEGVLREGDRVLFEGSDGEIEARIGRIEAAGEPVAEAHGGQEVDVQIGIEAPENAKVRRIEDPYDASDGEPLQSALEEPMA